MIFWMISLITVFLKNIIVDSAFVNNWSILTQTHPIHWKCGYWYASASENGDNFECCQSILMIGIVNFNSCSEHMIHECSLELYLRIGCTEVICILIVNEMIPWWVSESFVCVQYRSIRKWMIAVNVSIESLLRWILSLIKCWKYRLLNSSIDDLSHTCVICNTFKHRFDMSHHRMNTKHDVNQSNLIHNMNHYVQSIKPTIAHV
jgi:hypothetical protein